MLSAKLIEDEYELRYYKFFNSTFFYESLKSTWHEMIAVKIAVVRKIIDEDINERSEYLEYLNADETTCKENANKLLDNIRPIIQKYLEIPKNILIPIDGNRVASGSLQSLKAEVANLELELRKHKLYTDLLNQRLEEFKTSEKIADRVSTIFIELNEKIIDKKEILNKLEALSDMAKSGDDVSEKLLSIENVVESIQSLSVNEHSS